MCAANQVLEQTLAESAAPVELDGKADTVINGRIAARAGRDRFAFTAMQGETWTFDCFADRIRSRFDPVLEITDAAGVSLKLAQSTWESDPRFAYTFAKTGRYFLTVRDSEYNGGPNYTYRLLAGRVGLVSTLLPRGGQPGKTVALTLQGANLAATATTVTLPADAPSGVYWANIAVGRAGSPGSSGLPLLPTARTFACAPDGRMGPRRRMSGAWKVCSRCRLCPPILTACSPARPAPVSRFTPRPKRKILFDLLGRRIGSRIDGAIRILDAAGKEIAANDDAPELGKDARLEFAAPADGNYTVEISNVEEVIGPDCGYRLVVHPGCAGFSDRRLRQTSLPCPLAERLPCPSRWNVWAV